jgi:hypothetical protein
MPDPQSQPFTRRTGRPRKPRPDDDLKPKPVSLVPSPQQAEDIEHRRQIRYLTALSEEGTIGAGLKKAAITRSRLFEWREHIPNWDIREQQARDDFADRVEAEAVRRGVEGVETPVYQAGKLIGYKTEYSDPLLILVLRAVRPDRYREKLDVVIPQIIKAVGVDPSSVL